MMKHLIIVAIAFVAQLAVLLFMLGKERPWSRIALAAVVSSAVGLLFGWLGKSQVGLYDMPGWSIAKLYWVLGSVVFNAVLLGFALWFFLRPINRQQLLSAVVFSQLAYAGGFIVAGLLLPRMG